MVDKEDEDALEKLRQSEVYNTINAKKNNRIHIVNRELWAKTRGIMAAEFIIDEIVNFKEG